MLRKVYGPQLVLEPYSMNVDAVEPGTPGQHALVSMPLAVTEQATVVSSALLSTLITVDFWS